MGVPSNKHAGDRFGRLVLLRKVGRQNGSILWRCQCDCGNKKTVASSNLGFHTKSCGCLKAEQRRFQKYRLTHGRTKTAEYSVWSSMRARCNNPNNDGYEDYGGRGIKVCDRWQDSFENFFADMGERPGQEFSLDREDNDGDYSKDNCRWSIQLTQGRNRRPRHRWREKVRGSTKLTARGLEKEAIAALSFGC